MQLAPEHRLSILIHAGAKVGKSTLTSTAPKPVLVLDAEGSWRFIPVRKTYWNPMNGAPPQCNGEWDACIVQVNNWQTVEMTYKWLTQSETCFTSVVVDSITEIQRRCKQNLKGIEALRIQDWGVLLNLMDSVIRGFRDLTLIEGSNVRCVVFVAETRQNSTTNKWVPYMQGQIAVSLPYWTDVVGYLYASYENDSNGQATREIRQMISRPHPQFEAGERVQGRLPNPVTIYKPDEGMIGDDIERWMYKIYDLQSNIRSEVSEDLTMEKTA